MSKVINNTLTDPDLVDRIFEYLLREFPHIEGPQLAKAKRAVRDEFRGEDVYIASRGPTERQAIAASVLQLFNGRNASEVARRLNIGRASVYRILKQSHRKDRLSIPGNETGKSLRSAIATASQTQPDPTAWPSPVPTSPPSTPPSPAVSSQSPATDEPSPTAA